MKPKTFTYLTLAAALIAASACTDNGNPAAADPNAPVAARIIAAVGNAAVATPDTRAGQPSTRAVDGTWNADNIGVVALTSPDHEMYGRYRNAHYVTTSTTSTAEFTPADADHTIYFSGPGEEVVFCAYAPYQPTATPDALPGPKGDGNMSIDTRLQTSDKEQEAIDFIAAWGAIASKSNPTVSFKGDHSFHHVMSRLVLKIETPASAGFNADDVERISSVKIGGLCTRSYVTIDYMASRLHVGPEADSRLEEWDITENVNSVKIEDGVKRRIYTLIFPPKQRPTDKEGNRLKAIPLSITLDKQEYRNTTGLKGELNDPGYFDRGKSYEYTILLKKQDLEVTDATIQDWVVGGTTTGDATPTE